MAFSLDRIVDHVKVDEPNLISIHRSTQIIVPSDDSCMGHLCEAFICATRENKSIHVYVALYDTRQKSNLVFVSDPVTSDKRALNALIREAEIFLQDLGFSMEPVNLKFSPAVREVIMRDMKFMRPPRHQVEKLKSEPEFEMQKAEVKAILQLDADKEMECHLDNHRNSDHEFVLATRLAEVTAAMERLASEKEEMARKVSKEFKQIRAERDTLKQELDAARLAEQEATCALTINSKNVNKIKSEQELERDSLISDLSSAQEEIENLRCKMSENQIEHENENMALREEIEQLRGEHEITTASLSSELGKMRNLMAKNRDGSAKTIASLESENDALRSELSSAHEEIKTVRCLLSETQNDLNGEICKLREVIKELQAEREAATADFSCKLEALQSSLEKANDILLEERSLTVKQQNSTVLISKEVEALKAALSIAEEILSAERAKNESALQEMDALERNAAIELKSLKKKVDSLCAEKRLLESMATEMKLKAKGEIEQLQQVNQSQRRAAVKKVNALKEEMRQLADARALMTSPFAMLQSQGNEPNPQAIADKPVEYKSPEDLPGSDQVASSPFGFSGNAEYINFEPDMDLHGIPYVELEDVIEIHRSFNKIQAAPSGKLVQRCEGFVCLVKNGKKKAVFVAWLMCETGNVLICRPTGVSSENCDIRSIQLGGVGYFERVGFIMDSLVLEDDRDKRQNQIDMLNIFKRTILERAA